MSKAEIVTDANLWLNVVLPLHSSHIAAQQLVADCETSGVTFIAPSWWEAEADSPLRGMVKGGLISPDAAREARSNLDAAAVMPVHDARVRPVARDMADTIKRGAVYYATYAALAVVRGCEFWTADTRFYNAVQLVQVKLSVKYLDGI